MHTYTGVPASTGIVVGPVEQIDHGTTGLHRIVCDPFRERALYDVAVVLAKDELRRLSQRAKGPDADILLFQIALLEDESFTNEIGDYIAAGAGGAAGRRARRADFAGRLKTSMMSTSGSAARCLRRLPPRGGYSGRTPAPPPASEAPQHPGGGPLLPQ